MSVYLVTSLLTFVVWQALSLYRPDWIASNVNIGERQNETGLSARNDARIEPLKTTTQLMIFVFSLAFLFVICLWLISYYVFHVLHPPLGLSLSVTDAFIGRNASALLFGAITGCLAGITFNRIFYRQNYELTKRDNIIVFSLGFFMFLGIGGEAVVKSLASRVSKIGIAGAEITFADQPNDVWAANPNNASLFPLGEREKGDSPLGSNASRTGLKFLQFMPELIESDNEYVRLLERNSAHQKEIVTGLGLAKAVAAIISMPISRCATAIYYTTWDSTEIDEIFSQLLKKTKTITQINYENIEDIRAFPSTYFTTANNLVSNHKGLIAKDKRLVPDCKFLVAELCDTSYLDSIRSLGLAGSFQFPEIKEERILDVLKKDCNRSAFIENINRILDPDKMKGIRETYPYASIARASMLAQIGQYEAAILELVDWNTEYIDRKKQIGNDWFHLRVQYTISSLIEEWIRKSLGQHATFIAGYHTQLIDKTTDETRNIFALNKFRNDYALREKSLEDEDFKFLPVDERPCDLSADDKTRARVFTAVVNSELASAYRKLMTSDYAKNHSHKVAATISEFLRTDFSCLVGTNKDKAIMRAELLGLYARMKASDVRASRDVRDDQSIKADLKLAVAALDLGQEVIERHGETCADSAPKGDISDRSAFMRALSGDAKHETCVELREQRAKIRSTLMSLNQ